jgi:hypothetical protein
MSVQKVPALVLALSGKVNMTPIAWKIDPTSVTIVFEQGPKMIFNRDQVLDAVEPVIHSMEEAMHFVKAAEGGRVVGDHGKPLPKRKPRK